MLVLFDNGTPRTLARYLIDYQAVTEARANGWQELANGDLLKEAEAAGFEVLVMTDKILSYQQNLAGRRIAVVVLGQGRWTLIKRPADPAELVLAEVAATRYMLLNLFHATALANAEGGTCWPIPCSKSARPPTPGS
jgi:hypothetical protein